MIKNTYSEFNLAFLSQKDRKPFLAPFFYADRTDPAHLQAIGKLIQSEFVWMADDRGKIVGVLRGRMDWLGSLFVAKSYHGQKVGRGLVEVFEEMVQSRGGEVIRVASSIYAVPFYESLGYKKSTGIRKSWSFEGYGFPIQHMKKYL